MLPSNANMPDIQSKNPRYSRRFIWSVVLYKYIQLLHQRRHDRALRIGLERKKGLVLASHGRWSVDKRTHHGLNVRMRHGLELRELQLVVGTNVDVSALVLGHVAVLGRREDGDALSVVLLLVTLHADLVTADDSLQAVLVAETLCYVGTELHADAALAGAAAGEWLRIGPEHLHHETSLAGLLLLVAVELADVVERDVVVREETAVEDEVLVADQGGKWEGRETFREQLVGSGR